VNDRFDEPADHRLQADSQKTSTDEDDIEWKQFIQQQLKNINPGGASNRPEKVADSQQPASEAAYGTKPLQVPEPLAPNGEVLDDEATGEEASSLEPRTDKRRRKRRKRKAKAAELRISQPSSEHRGAQASPQALVHEPLNAERLISHMVDDQPPPLQSQEPQPSIPVSAPKRNGKRTLSRKAGNRTRKTAKRRKGKIGKRPRAPRSTKAVKPSSQRVVKKNRMRRSLSKKRKFK
jgi:hypothetical protein